MKPFAQSFDPMSFLDQRPLAILFDWDDTLINTWPYLWDLYKKTFAQFGYDLTSLMDEVTCKDKAVRNGRKTFIDAMGEETGAKARDFFLTTYADTFIHSLSVLEGAEQTLEIIKNIKIPMGIVSNKESTFLKHEIEKLGWDKYFESIVGRDIVGPKPNPAPLVYALDEMGYVPGKNIWFIGDTAVDQETAIAAGCSFIGYGDDFGFNTKDAPLRVNENIESVANWNQFHAILEKINLK